MVVAMPRSPEDALTWKRRRALSCKDCHSKNRKRHGDALLLDNLSTDVVSANSMTSYRPYYSINEIGWWRHIAANTVQTARR
jgi:hypothetical protein